MSMRGKNKVVDVYISPNVKTASETEPLAIRHSALTGWESYRFLVKLLNVTLTNLMYVCPYIIYEIDERYPLDATIYLLL